MTIATAPLARAAARSLETELFSTRSVPVGLTIDAHSCDAQTYGGDELLEGSRSRSARVSARAAYQEVLYGRAVLVDIRPQAQRDHQGEVHPDLSPVVIEHDVLALRLDPSDPWSLPIADLGLRVIVICQEGYASSVAAEALRRLGVHRATDVVGGVAAWRDAGLPHRERQHSDDLGGVRSPGAPGRQAVSRG